MVWDLLLEWMTHLGSGAWEGFREAVAELASDEFDGDENGLLRRLRITFSDLGHADFFVEGSRRWHVLRPALVGISRGGEHLFVGGRTRLLVDQLCTAVAPHAVVTVSEITPGFSCVQIVGDPLALSAAAQAIGIEYISNASAMLSGRLRSIRSSLESAQRVQEPINWSVRSWSFHHAEWVGETLDRTVREYSNRHGVLRYFVHLGRPGLREIEKRAAVYCAALVRGVRLVDYSSEERSLRIPRWAPLPEMHARVACLSGGRVGAIVGENIEFRHVDPRIALALLVSLGQGFPMSEAK